MWIFSKDGFLSVVEKAEDKDRGTLTVRSRCKKDLEGLVKFAGLDGIKSNAGSDYQFRVVVPREAFADYMAAAARGIDYHNFKDAILRQDSERSHLLTKIWHEVFRFFSKEKGS